MNAGSDSPNPDTHAGPADSAQPSWMTIDELAAHTRVPSRTIRFYQAKGALMAPEIRGRTAFYGPAHVDRLEAIGMLKDRGLSIRAIRDLMSRIERGDLDLGEWLGLEERLTMPWSEDAPTVLSSEELNEALAGLPTGTLALTIEFGLVERRGDRFLVQSPGMLQVLKQVHAAGVDVALAAEAGDIIEKHARALTSELVQLFVSRAGRGFGASATPDAIRETVAAVRAPARDAVTLLFSRTMQEALRKLVESGLTLDPKKLKFSPSRRR
ncbi:MAG: MerR family transcriptional regulator [Sandaracinaceae bacterium]|nr:MerR family transcriptional regulator [Sandaracinaceae bacterium]